MGKSLISHQGSAEFAKRFRVRNLSQDISPISIRALMNSHHPYGTMAVQLQYPMKRFSTLCRDWLRSVHWYWSTAMDPWVTIHQLFDAPVPEVTQNSYTASRRGYSLTKTGILVEGRAPQLLYPEVGTSKMVIPSQTTKRTQNQSNHSRLLIQLTDKTTRKGDLSRKYELGYF
ncbi:hypothetical protein VNO77_50189 [Canavalia gladiata]|uniref:Uncharacterized protein n=1 Tax=Canavalia gladiata TaxID=3824 RepID=A0AAN9PG95_CANGL